MKRIAKFHKVSWEQFRKDWVDTFGEQPEEKIREIYEGIKLPKRATREVGYDFLHRSALHWRRVEMVKIPNRCPGWRWQKTGCCACIREAVLASSIACS